MTQYGSVCSGIEAATVAWHPLGWRAEWFAEIEPFPSAVLAHHWPEVSNLGDMTKLASRVLAGSIAAPDVLVGGTPCQAFSVAGMRAGLDDPRGQLTIKYVELADAVDHVRPAGDECVIVWENVPGVLSDKGNAFGCFLGALVGESDALQPSGGKWTDAGCVYGPRRTAAWRVLDAQYFGLAQRRRRVFVVASARAGFDPAAVLFESEGMRRDTAPRRGEGQDASRAASLCAAFGGNNTSGPIDIAPARNACASASGRMDFESEAFIVHGTQDPCVSTDTAFALGRNNGAENAVFAIQAGALRTNPMSGPDGVGVQADHAYTLEARSEVQAVCVTGDITHTLKADGFDGFDGSEDGTGRGQPIVSVALRGMDGGATAELGDELAGCLRASSGGGDKPHALVSSAVRRLTPRECERLQGFPESTFTLAIEVCAEESRESVSCAGLDSAAKRREQSAPVVARVLIDCERLQVLQPSAGRSMSNAPSAVAQRESRQPTLTGDFVRLAALTLQELEREIRAGRVESLPSISGSSRPLSGSAHARLSGRVIDELVSDAERLTKDASLCTKSITSQLGRNSQSLGSTLEISLCCVAAAIVSSIPKTTQPGSSFVVIVETTSPYTLIPWRGKPAEECPDGPRYKAIGNSKAVPVVRWIGRRIKQQLER